MKRYLYTAKWNIILSIFMLVLLLGCDKKEATANSAAEIVGNLSFATWASNQNPGMQANIDLFTKAYANTSVELQVIPWNEYWQRLRTEASAGNLPDIFWMHVLQFDLFASSDVLVDLGERIAKDTEISLDNYPQDLVKLYQYNGRQYAIPKDFDTIGLWYNKALFDEAAVEYPNENWTWDDLLAAGKKLTNKQNGVYGFLADNSSQEGWWNFIYQNGGAVVRPNGRSGFDLPETIEAVQRYADFILVDGIAPSLGEADPQMFFSGKIAMRQMGSWMVGTMDTNDYAKANLDVAMLPKGPKGRATMYNGLGYSIAAGTQNPETAWAFVKVLGSEAGQRLQAEKGAAIPAFRGTLEPWAASFHSNYNLAAYPEQLPYAVGYPQAPGAAEWLPLMEETMAQILAGTMPAESGLKKLAEKMNRIIDENK